MKFLPKTIRDRNSAIQKSLLDARTATEEARERLSGVEERLGKLDGEIAAMRALAEQDSARAEQRIKATVEDEKARILAAAEQEIASATSHAQKKLRSTRGPGDRAGSAQAGGDGGDGPAAGAGFAQRLTGDDPKKGQN